MDKRGLSKVFGGLLIILFLVLSVSFVMADLSYSDNYVNYKNNDLTVEIKDETNLTIGKMELTSHRTVDEIKNIIPGVNRTVQVYDFYDWKEYKEGIGEIEITNMKNGKKENKDYWIAEIIYEEYDIPIYDTNCEKKLAINGSYYDECISEIIEVNTYKNIKELNPYNSKDIPNRNITLAVVTDVYDGDYYDVIWTVAGVKLSEHSEWKGSYVEGIMGYWQFNETFGTNAKEFFNGTYDLTVTGAFWNSTGFIGGSYGIFSNEGTNTNFDFGNCSQVAIKFDIILTTSIDKVVLEQGYDGWINGAINVYAVPGTNFIRFRVRDDTGIKGNANDVDLTLNTWKEVFFIVNSTHSNVYLDGVLDTSYALSNFAFNDAPNLTLFGDRNLVEDIYGVNVDEIGVWCDKTFTAQDINDFWNSGIGITPPAIPTDTTPPDVTIILPLSTNYTEHSIEFNLNVTDESTIDSCWYNLNDGINITMNDNAPEFYYTNSSIKKGTYTAKFYCKDIFDNLNDSEQVTFTILNSPPTHNNPLLKTLTYKNLSSEDLICSPQNVFDADNDDVTNIYNWYKDSQPLLSLNLPFEINADDYSGAGNDGSISGATFINSKEGLGNALSFDSVDDYVEVTDNFGTLFNSFSAEAWVKLKNIGTQHRYILERDDTHFYISIMPDKKIRFRHVDLTNEATETEINAIEFDEWTHIAVVYDGTKTYIYVNGDLKKEQEDTGNISFSATESLYIGSSKYAPSYPDRTWNGSIDEVRVYPYALTQEQIVNNFNLNYDTIVSEETVGGDSYMCQVTPNDAEADGVTLNSSELEVLWGISFNVISGEDGSQLNNSNIYCNNGERNITGADSFEEFGFENGSYECVFEKEGFYNKDITFTADNDKIVPVKLSVHYRLTIEEHTWLEAIYNCLYSGDCYALNLLEQINETTTNVWNQLQTTDTDVVLNEDVTSYEVSTTSNLSIDYTIYVPEKAGYSEGDYLPIRIAYWFLDGNNETCYDQGDKPTGVEAPYCYPLVIETLGPMDGEVSFTVDLRPELPEGTYTIVRDIEIDPSGVWIKYGQEFIGKVEILDSVSNSWISLTKDKNSNSDDNLDEEATIESKQTEEDNTINLGDKITGAIIGASQISGWHLVAITGIISGIFIVLIICQTILKVKKK